MTRFFLLTAWLLTLASAVRAQYVPEGNAKNEEARLFLREDFVGFSAGISDPNGDYGDVTYENYNAGYALTGYNLNLSYGRLLNENLGFQLMLTHSSNAFDAITFNSQLISANQNVHLTLEATRYYTTALLAGLYCGLPMENGRIDFRFLAGYAISRTPRLESSSRDSLFTEIITIQSSSARSLAFDFGLGLRYDLSNSFSASFNLDYYYTKPEFQLTATSNLGNYSKYSQKISITMLNPCIGLIYRLR